MVWDAIFNEDARAPASEVCAARIRVESVGSKVIFIYSTHVSFLQEDYVRIFTVKELSELGYRICILSGCGGLVVRLRLWGQRAPGSKPDSIEDPPCMGPVASQIIRSGQTSSR
ncbi:hypothetical protein AVEN_101281-1 [Araneus ventricosus]|uniref:Uncharacterized protein n=1 Tax=Araneus ventricosus TaxID=182803 RepID=A0A4Y2EQY5_ARAVE|nr:hypothetical protein AVEN_101281-1 [Araneus ventricosus]